MSILEKMEQVRIDAYGSPDMMKIVEADDPTPAPGEILIKSKNRSVVGEVEG